MLTTIFVMTPCLNARETIDNTILSVVTQEGDFQIRYHVQDGGSTDGTRERLEWWQRRLGSKGFPIQCLGVDFTVSSGPDEGMYDAICQGFEAMEIHPNAFMTWINADDILMPGALAFVASVDRQFTPEQVSWLGGAACVIRNGMAIASYDRIMPTSALRAGICDGIHWDFLQQEGTFFRRKLWEAIEPNRTFRPLKLAGDWNLWRLFATQTNFVQWKIPLGGFRSGTEQLSVRLRDKYMAEIEALVSSDARAQRLAALPEDGMVKRHNFAVDYRTGKLTIQEEVRNGTFKHHYQNRFGSAPSVTLQEAAAKKLHVGTLHVQAHGGPSPVSFDGNILAFDREWQFPAVTEQHAFHRLRDIGAVPEGVTYVAYPWATLIDKLQTKSRDAHLYLREFRAFCRKLPQDTVKVTVCQHILMRRFLELFRQAGIETVFWTHATHDDVKDDRADIRIRAFPLYPVQVLKAETEEAERPHLFSFIGAKSNAYYLTQARSWILEQLADHPRGLIIGRDSWHYNKVVYDHQILKAAKADANLVDQAASDRFRKSLRESVFSLCPSGSGPNTIRLWESIGAGAIPVILADTYATPGNPKLWEQAAIFCEETPEAIAALPARLEEIAADPQRLAAMRHAMRQIWLLYGPDSFVYDVQHFMLEQAGRGASGAGGARTGGSFADRVLKTLGGRTRLSQEEALLLLRSVSSDMLIGGTPAEDPLSDHCPLGQLVALARETLPATHPTLKHFDQVVAHGRAWRDGPAVPAISRGTGPAVCLFGRHANRTPLAYDPFRRLVGGRLSFVEDPAKADVVMTGFNLDLRENAEVFVGLAKSSPDTRIMVISEEPLWDSVWSGGFKDRARTVTLDGTSVPYHFLNHSNSGIFDFEKIPYFLLTNEDFLTRYGMLVARHAGLTPGELLAHWQKAPISAAFFAEVREDERYACAYPDQDVYGLSVYRTQVARKVQGADVLREGMGWKAQPRRQDLADWHLDKLAALDGRVRLASAYENTHQTAYISEKIFDAFVVGGIPSYYAGPGHRILELVPEGCMVNTYGLEAEAAAEKIAACRPDAAFVETWLRTADALRARFTDIPAVVRERQRILDAVISEMEALF
ncbi:exostosin family protein [Ponticoccus gilvus]|nr:exostosin family protein [Enemella evansiae]